MIGDRSMVERRIAFLTRVLGDDAPERPTGMGLDGWLEMLEAAFGERRSA